MNDMTEGLKEVITGNKEVILAGLKKLGFESVNLSYEGCGDSGNGFYIDYFPKNEVIDTSTEMITFSEGHGTWDKKLQKSVYSFKQTLMSLDLAVERFFGDVLDLNDLNGYCNGDGGGGDISLNVEKNAYLLEHYDLVVRREESSYGG
jgi:hypothetical protein